MSVAKEEADVLAIDEHRLDEEWVRQPAVFGRYALKLAEKRSELDAAKSRLDVVEAETDRDIRKMPENYGISKITEVVVERTIKIQLPYMRAVDKVNRLKHEVAVVQAYVDALDHKKKALENLVMLWLNSYFAEPRLPKGPARERMNDVVKREVRSRGK